MKNSNPIQQILGIAWVALLLVFTAWQTVAWVTLATPATGTALLVRQIVAVIVTDGSVLFWYFQTRVLKTNAQRRLAGLMLGSAVTLTCILGLLYVGFLITSWQAWATYVEAGAMGLLALWVGANVGMHMIISWLDPETRLTIDQANTDGSTLLERNRAYSQAMYTLRPVLAKAQSLKEVKQYAQLHGYTPAETNQIMAEAASALDEHYGRMPESFPMLAKRPPVAMRIPADPGRPESKGAPLPASPFVEVPSNGNGNGNGHRKP